MHTAGEGLIVTQQEISIKMDTLGNTYMHTAGEGLIVTRQEISIKMDTLGNTYMHNTLGATMSKMVRVGV